MAEPGVTSRMAACSIVRWGLTFALLTSIFEVPAWACGADGERACCIGCGELSNNGTACNTGTFLFGTSTSRACGGPPSCTFPFPFTTKDVCYAPKACGGPGQRACCPGEQPLPCNQGFHQGSGCSAGNPDCLCADGNFTTAVCRPAPSEILDFTAAADKVHYSWSAAPYATRYDVVHGNLASLPVGPGQGDEFCFNDVSATTVSDSLVPAPGFGYWYLVRGENEVDGTYGNRSDGSPRTTTTCPLELP